ncbi:MAG TPA: DUF3501 family protein [Acidimicrobiales bacterium]|nr:DUF3501 family protein [Acidimicrobiales bacterium]
MAKLTLDDIADLRAYERERDAFRRRVIALKQRRRVPLGQILTLLFENRDTIRFQVQEMARVEKIISDEGIQAELDVYNPLIPGPGQLSATLFVELTSREELERWLPRLVGIERSVGLRLADGELVAATVEEAHAEQLTRDEVTASVHYLRWDMTPSQVERFDAGPVSAVVDHPAYRAETPLADDTLAELRADLRGGG